MSQSIGAVVRCCTSCGATFRSDFIRCPIDGGAVMVADCDPLIGSVLEPYEIDALIGEGSMGRVYRAHDIRDPDRECAVKVLYGDMASMATMRQRFAKEAEIASRMDHPNVVSVFDTGSSERGLMFIAMELVEGRSLATMVGDGPMAADRVVRLARGICSGLAHAHSMGLIHRDLKPDNILVVDGPGGEVPRLVDFGIAISMNRRDPRLTATGFTLGTPGYVAPEQTLTGVPVDHRADLYALGVTLYEMLTGMLPFEGGMLDVILAKASTPAPAMIARAPWVRVPAVFEQLVQKLIQRRADDRYGSVEEVLDALDVVQAAISTDSLDTEQYVRFEAGELGIGRASTLGGDFDDITEVAPMPGDPLPPVIVESMPVITKQQPVAVPHEELAPLAAPISIVVPPARRAGTDHLRTDLLLSRQSEKRFRSPARVAIGAIGFAMAAAAAAIAWWWILPDVSPAPAAPMQVQPAPVPVPVPVPEPEKAAAPAPAPVAVAPEATPAPASPTVAPEPAPPTPPKKKPASRRSRAPRSAQPAPAPAMPAEPSPPAETGANPDSAFESESAKRQPVDPFQADEPTAPAAAPASPPLPTT